MPPFSVSDIERKKMKSPVYSSTTITREIIMLGIPLVATMLIHPLIALIDMTMMGHKNDTAWSAGLAVGSSLFMNFFWLFGFLYRSTLTHITHAIALGDTQLEKLHREFAQDWTELARNSGRKFTPSVAHEPEQSAFDFGDIEYQEHLSKLPFKETG